MPSCPLDDQPLSPEHRYLSDESVLVQAWKKTHQYIRQHNWYSDPLELDLKNIRIEDRIRRWAESMRMPDALDFVPRPMRLVLAPNSAS